MLVAVSGSDNVLKERNGSVEQQSIADVLKSISNERVLTHIRALKIGAQAVGALALGALPIGALRCFGYWSGRDWSLANPTT